MSLLEDARAILPWIIDLRRRIHRRPELGLDLPETQALVVETLTSLGVEPQLGQGLSSVTAVIGADRPGRTVVLRADMDALPMPESSGVEYASETCRFEFAEGDVRVAVLATPSGDPFGADGFAELQAASASRTGSDDFPHEDIEGVGSAAFFVGSLLGNQLVVDTGSVVLSIEGDADGEPLSRDAISAVAAIAVDALG